MNIAGNNQLELTKYFLEFQHKDAEIKSKMEKKMAHMDNSFYDGGPF